MTTLVETNKGKRGDEACTWIPLLTASISTIVVEDLPDCTKEATILRGEIWKMYQLSNEYKKDNNGHYTNVVSQKLDKHYWKKSV